jgi:hypothetical protein
VLCCGFLLSDDLHAIENVRHSVDGEGDISEDSEYCLLDVRHRLICNLHACVVSEVVNCRKLCICTCETVCWL